MQTNQSTSPKKAALVALGVFPPKFSGQRTRSLSMFVIDGKGVLWQDAVKLAMDRGWKYRVIGIEEGEWGLDLCDGLEPSAIVSALRDAGEQVSGGGKEANPIFRDMGLEIIRACLNVLRCYELTPQGFAEVKQLKERLYSLSHAQDLAQSVLDPAGRLFKIVEAIHKTAADPQLVRTIAPLLTSDLWADIKFLRKDLPNRPEDTVTSFLLNVHNLLGGFTSNPAVRSRFGAARGNQLEIDAIWDDKTVTAFRLSPQTGVGVTARLVAILTKIRIYNRASVRQLIDADVGKFAKLTFIGDEFQEIATTGLMGEAAVTAWSRSTGMSLIFATQSLAGLYARIGKEPTHALLSNMRTKLFLQTEEPADKEYITKLGGEVRRSLMAGADEYESWHARQLEVNGVIDDTIVPPGVDDVDYSLSVGDVFGKPKKVVARQRTNKVYDPHQMVEYLRQLAHDSKFVSAEATLNQALAADASAEYQAVRTELDQRQRQEDQERNLFAAGNERQSLWTGDDLQELGMGQAVAFVNVSGVLQQDIITVDPELAKPKAQRETITVDAQVLDATPVAQIAQSASDAVLARRRAMADKVGVKLDA